MPQKQKRIEDLQADANRLGGVCLSTEYVGMAKNYLYRCAKGHEFYAAAHNVGRGHWCRICMCSWLTLRDLQEEAASRGGQCLSKECLGVKAKYRWRCEKGHEWDATGISVRRGHWCPECRKFERKPRSYSLSIEELQKMARLHNGECLSKFYRGTNEKYHWRCRHGHEWHSTARSVRSGSWCPTCNHNGKGAGRRPLTLGDLQKTAHRHKGECLSTEYSGANTNYRWRCRKGHEWLATAGNVRQGRWCPICKREKRASRRRR